MRTRAVIFDRDGTMFSVEHHKVDGEIGCWHCYNGLAAFDSPVPEMVEMAHTTHEEGLFNIMTSGRMEAVRPAFTAGLRKHDVPIDLLLMRRDGDTRKDSIIKEEMYHNLIEPYYEIVWVFDDRQQVVDMWRSLGLRVVQVVDPGIPPLLGS